MKLYPWQVAGVDWLRRQSRALLADEMGLGKSITTLVAAEQAGVRSLLVLAPTVVAHNWLRELERWAPQRQAGLLTSAAGLRDAMACPTVVTTHGLLIRDGVFKALRDRPWDLVVLDESHLFRNESAQRTRAFYGHNGLASGAKRVWLLTGTPMPNHAGELWPMLRSLWPERCPYSYRQFIQKFCRLEWSPFTNDWKIIGNRDLAGIKAMLAGLFLRRRKEDHLDLPPIRWETLVLPAPANPDAAWAELDSHLQELIADVTSTEAKLDILRANEDFARYRRLCGLAKVESTGELLRQELESGLPKVLIVAHHLDVLDGLAKGLAAYGPVMFTGAVPAARRQENVDLFQRDPATRVALCQIVAGGVGITLTAAAEVVFVEQSFVPGDNAQVADRVHRIGQSQPVRARFLSLANSVDQLVAETVARKTQMISEVLGEKVGRLGGRRV